MASRQFTFTGFPTPGEPFASDWLDIWDITSSTALKTIWASTPQGGNDFLRTRLQFCGNDPLSLERRPSEVFEVQRGGDWQLLVDFSANFARVVIDAVTPAELARIKPTYFFYGYEDNGAGEGILLGNVVGPLNANVLEPVVDGSKLQSEVAARLQGGSVPVVFEYTMTDPGFLELELPTSLSSNLTLDDVTLVKDGAIGAPGTLIDVTSDGNMVCSFDLNTVGPDTVLRTGSLQFREWALGTKLRVTAIGAISTGECNCTVKVYGHYQ